MPEYSYRSFKEIQTKVECKIDNPSYFDSSTRTRDLSSNLENSKGFLNSVQVEINDCESYDDVQLSESKLGAFNKRVAKVRWGIGKHSIHQASESNPLKTQRLHHRWEGIVRCLIPPNFSATVYDLDGNFGKEEVEMPIALAKENIDKLKEGTRFYLYKGEKVKSNGQVISFTEIKIKVRVKKPIKDLEEEVERLVSFFRR